MYTARLKIFYDKITLSFFKILTLFNFMFTVKIMCYYCLNHFKISKVGANRKAYYFDATHHAREWLSTATLLNIMDHVSS